MFLLISIQRGFCRFVCAIDASRWRIWRRKDNRDLIRFHVCIYYIHISFPLLFLKSVLEILLYKQKTSIMPSMFSTIKVCCLYIVPVTKLHQSHLEIFYANIASPRTTNPPSFEYGPRRRNLSKTGIK